MEAIHRLAMYRWRPNERVMGGGLQTEVESEAAVDRIKQLLNSTGAVQSVKVDHSRADDHTYVLRIDSVNDMLRLAEVGFGPAQDVLQPDVLR